MTAGERELRLAPARRPLTWVRPGNILRWLANPLAGKELLARMRGPRTFVIATLELLPLVALAAGLYATIAAAPAGSMSSGTPVGKLFFAAVTALELGLVCLLAPALTADLISGERERQTLDLLLVTPLSRRQIVLGKLVAALGSLLLLIVLALPIQAVAVLIGGVGVEELLVGLLILTLTAATYGCVGLYWSARLRTTRAALLLSYVTTLVGVGGLPLALLLTVIASALFGFRVDEDLWPATWLVSGPQTTSLRLGGPNVVVDGPSIWIQVEGIVSQLVVASNPLLAGIASASNLVLGRPAIGVERVLNADLLYVAPWLTFSAVHLLAIMALIWLTARALRRETR